MAESIKNFFVNLFGSAFGDKIAVFLCSMLPIIELRGSIPLGAACGIPWYLNFIISIAGNLLPVPFILLLIKKILEWMKTTKAFSRFALWLEKRAEKNKGKLEKGVFLGLMLFVAIPIPGTGAWTGALLAALSGTKFKTSMLAIAIGVILAGIIMTLASYGVVGFLSFLK
ncbi:MAG: small multi-drug export protein [Clostridia bacterium]|nr:small multi-drug export protein [Clostridia bacterium]